MYIDGKCADPAVPDRWATVVDPATEQEVTQVAAASEADIDAAVKVAHGAVPAHGRTTREERLALLEGLLSAYKRRLPDISAAMNTEVGIPASFCESVQAPIGQRHLETAIEVLKEYPFEVEWGHVFKDVDSVCSIGCV
jgi:aldehyde dehydrogenase (NAD+)